LRYIYRKTYEEDGIVIGTAETQYDYKQFLWGVNQD
jgi:hypothetical protein